MLINNEEELTLESVKEAMLKIACSYNMAYTNLQHDLYKAEENEELVTVEEIRNQQDLLESRLNEIALMMFNLGYYRFRQDAVKAVNDVIEIEGVFAYHNDDEILREYGYLWNGMRIVPEELVTKEFFNEIPGDLFRLYDDNTESVIFPEDFDEEVSEHLKHGGIFGVEKSSGSAEVLDKLMKEQGFTVKWEIHYY